MLAFISTPTAARASAVLAGKGWHRKAWRCAGVSKVRPGPRASALVALVGRWSTAPDPNSARTRGRQMTQLASMGGDTAADFEASGTGVTVAPQSYVLSESPGPLGSDELGLIDAWWRAANYLAVGQIYLMANPLLRDPLRPEDIKP